MLGYDVRMEAGLMTALDREESRGSVEQKVKACTCAFAYIIPFSFSIITSYNNNQTSSINIQLIRVLLLQLSIEREV